jgi:hypothetical protein
LVRLLSLRYQVPRLYVDANPSYIAYVLDGGGSGYQKLPTGYTNMEAEYLAVMYGLTEYFNKWNRELDARQFNKTLESGGEFFEVGTPSDRTPRPLPPAVLVCSDSEVVVKQLSRQYHIKEERLRKLAQNIWDITQNVEVKYQWVSRKENIAGKMLP